jgi:hypothetical protein
MMEVCVLSEILYQDQLNNRQIVHARGLDTRQHWWCFASLKIFTKQCFGFFCMVVLALHSFFYCFLQTQLLLSHILLK